MNFKRMFYNPNAGIEFKEIIDKTKEDFKKFKEDLKQPRDEVKMESQEEMDKRKEKNKRDVRFAKKCFYWGLAIVIFGLFAHVILAVPVAILAAGLDFAFGIDLYEIIKTYVK